MTATTAAVLRVEDLRIGYRTRAGLATAVDGVGFEVRAGEVVALVGESGSGKTSTAHAIVGLLPGSGELLGGHILLDGVDIAGWSDRRLRTVRGSVVGLVPQDPTVSLDPVKPIGRQVAEALRAHGLAGRRSATVATIDILTKAGLDDPEACSRRYPHELSGGMRQRVLIGIALACRPKVIIADEPTSALDVTVQARVLDHLAQITGEYGTAVLLITHDLGVAADRADRILVMKQGLVVEQGDAARVLGDPEHPYTRDLIAAAPSLASVRLTSTGTGDGREPIPLPRGAAEGPGGNEPAALSVERLVKEFDVPSRGRANPVRRAVDDVSFSIPRGTTFALVGESGSGKTTAARLILRLTEPTSGRVLINGRDVTDIRGTALRRLREHLQVVYQNPYTSMDPRQTVAQIIIEPLRNFRTGTRADRTARAAEALDQVALPTAMLGRKPAELSGGQRQRVAIARALILRPQLLVLDEPVSALDVSVQAQILQLLTDLQGALGLTYLFISHDLAVIRQISDTVGVLKDGRLVETGRTAEVFRHPAHPYTSQLLEAIPGRRAASWW